MLPAAFRRLFMPVALAAICAPAFADSQSAGAGAPFFGHELRRLHSDEVVNLSERFGGQPVLVVNTASHCGFTRQFRELESVHQKYKDRGLKVAGFPSDDFRQEAGDEAKTAEVCFENFGVTFDMFAPIQVTGERANPLFREIARQSAAPDWNFHKYVIDRNGRVVAAFPSRVKPDAPEVLKAIEKVL